METNQFFVQEQPARPEPIATARPTDPSASVLDPSAPVLDPSVPSYDPQKAAQFAAALRELYDPIHILLFGKLAGGTPHSDTFAYDLLVILEHPSPYNWYHAKRYLKMKWPHSVHGAPYVNVYVYTRHAVDAHSGPFFHWARKEGIVLYASHGRTFKRPRDTFDFGQAADAADRYARTFLSLADEWSLRAERMTDPLAIRLSAFSMAQATVSYFRTLFYVYHGFEADTCDVEMLQHRLRTLSGEIPLLFEADEYHPVQTLFCLKRYRVEARYDPAFFIRPEELKQHLDRVKQLGRVVTNLCQKRIALYRQRAR